MYRVKFVTVQSGSLITNLPYLIQIPCALFVFSIQPQVSLQGAELNCMLLHLQ